MRALLYDEIDNQDLDKLRARLAEVAVPAGLDDVYWLHLPDDLLTPDQAAHAECCGPHQVALVIEEGCFKAELLVRGAGAMRCSCFGYAGKAQRDFLLNFMDRLVEDLGVRT
jgi:hypothetical protein